MKLFGLERYGAPKNFYRLCDVLLPWLVTLGVLFLIAGLVGALYLAPTDYQQGDAFRILYVHVPSAFLSMMWYVMMAVWGSCYLIWRVKVADILAESCAPIGATLTACALLTGAIWGKPMWGTWWEWDARLTSELILLFLYFGYIALRQAYGHWQVAAKVSALLALIGLINIPIIHYSVEWWHTLHQGATLSKALLGQGQTTLPWPMLWPLLMMLLAFTLLTSGALLAQARLLTLKREQHKDWVKQL